jgi:exopolyphosphatase/guanosine-5'-triphosphate,3'-diphosphate pyrophosphatase
VAGVVRVAAIDCGTNSVRLLVADVPESGGRALAELVRRMEIVRLGEGVDRTGRLAPRAIERTRVALAGYAGEIRRLGAERVRMVATSATRDAANADEFAVMVQDALGVAPEVVSGDEEARLSYLGAVRSLPRSRYLVVDIGGGSTEFVTGYEVAERAVSTDIGCVRMTERHLHGDPPTPDQVAAAEADIEGSVERAVAAVAGRQAGTLVGLAGSVATVTGIALGLAAYDPARIQHARISYQEVAKVTADLLAMPAAAGAAGHAPGPGRRDRRRGADPADRDGGRRRDRGHRQRARHPRRDRLVVGRRRGTARRFERLTSLSPSRYQAPER